jgi:hypothetical protein
LCFGSFFILIDYSLLSSVDLIQKKKPKLEMDEFSSHSCIRIKDTNGYYDLTY